MTAKELRKAVDGMGERMYSVSEVRERMGISTMALMTDSDPRRGVDAGALDRMVQAGVRRIEIGADFGPSHFPYGNPTAVAELRRFYTDRGAEIYSVHSPYGRDPAQWNLEDAKRLIDAMAVAGAQVLVLHWRIWGQAEWQCGLEVMDRLAAMCRPHGIRLSIESAEDMTHDSNFADWFEFPQVGVCCDTGHAGVAYGLWNTMSDAGYVAQTFATSNGRLNHVHLSDVSTTPIARSHATKALKARQDHFSPGRGSSDWMAIFQCLKALEYPGCFMFELWTEDAERFERLVTFPERLTAGELGPGLV